MFLCFFIWCWRIGICVVIFCVMFLVIMLLSIVRILLRFCCVIDVFGWWNWCYGMVRRICLRVGCCWIMRLVVGLFCLGFSWKMLVVCCKCLMYWFFFLLWFFLWCWKFGLKWFGVCLFCMCILYISGFFWIVVVLVGLVFVCIC